MEELRVIGSINWDGVSALVHNKVLAAAPPMPSAIQCQRRYRTLHHPSDSFPPWSAEEKANLYQLVVAAQTGQDETFRKIKGKNKLGEPVAVVDWTKIAEHLDRSVQDVELAYENARLQNYKRGNFTEEEDQLIIQRVLEYEKTPVELRSKAGGLWVSLQRELNREDRRIAERYRMRLCKKDPSLPNIPSSRLGIAQKLELEAAAAQKIEDAMHDSSDSSVEKVVVALKPKKSGASKAHAAPVPVLPEILELPVSAPSSSSDPIIAVDATKPSVWIRWSPEMDAKLQEGRAQGKPWHEIADIVNAFNEQYVTQGNEDSKKRKTGKVNAKKCQDRFYRLPRLAGKDQTQEKLEEV